MSEPPALRTSERKIVMSRRKNELLEAAWGLIANAGWDAITGDVSQPKSAGWHEAAIRWRDDYHSFIGSQRLNKAAAQWTYALKHIRNRLSSCRTKFLF
jgi:hypothetical protein